MRSGTSSAAGTQRAPRPEAATTATAAAETSSHQGDNSSTTSSSRSTSSSSAATLTAVGSSVGEPPSREITTAADRQAASIAEQMQQVPHAAKDLARDIMREDNRVRLKQLVDDAWQSLE